MKKLKIAASILLLLNGVGAVYGGLSLMLIPEGRSLGLSLDLLKHSPFDNYFLPGLILFIINGVLSFVVLAKALADDSNSGWFIMLQGTLLSGWIVIQIRLIQILHPWHGIMLLVGLALLLIGHAQRKANGKTPDNARGVSH